MRGARAREHVSRILGLSADGGGEWGLTNFARGVFSAAAAAGGMKFFVEHSDLLCAGTFDDSRILGLPAAKLYADYMFLGHRGRDGEDPPAKSF